jgi:uridine kinase
MIIGIGGISRAGKSTLAKKLLDFYGSHHSIILHMDDYINAGYHIPSIEDQIDWEDPLSIDFQQLSYDFHWFRYHVKHVILEGLFAFYHEEINTYFDKKILMELDYATFYERKKRDLRWGQVPDWYIRHIWDSYLKYGKPQKMEDCLYLDGNEDKELDIVFEYLGALQS